MFDDDDDDSEPRFNVVDNYYFEEGNSDPVCFSVLPLKFDENGEVACLNSKKVDLKGFAHNGILRVHTQVVAWRVELHCQQPKILVLSSEGNWIELLKPRKCYENTVRSILITVQMLHFVRKWPRKRKRSLLDHLCEVFSKFDSKPAEYDLKKHRSIIKLFAEKDLTLGKSKILEMFTENTSRNIREGVRTKEPTIVSSSGGEEDLDNDTDDDYSGKEDKSDADYSCDDDDSDDQGNDDDKSNDDYSCNDDDSDDADGGDIDNDGDDDDGTDNLCAICDNGGKLLSCEGQCKRAFHPRVKDGIESNCETLGLTTAQLKEIDHYLCKNCEYKQHQCFSCGDLEPSGGLNAKVFQCYKASCGYFYHPSCIAKLLEPDDTDGACKLEKKIAAGMSFTCPVHWCSKCGKMEDSAHKAHWLAACRRCPVSFHKKCLPSEISFEKKRGGSIRAWQLDDRIIIYCGRHKIEDASGTPCRDRIKLPSITEMDSIGSHCMDHTPSVAEIDRTSGLAKKKAKVSGKRKMSTDQGSTGNTENSNKLCSEEGDETPKAGMNNSTEQITREGRGVLKKDTTHFNIVRNDEQGNFVVEEQAESDKNNTKSGKEKETRRVENAYGHDLISEKEKIPESESNKSGLTIGGFASGHVDGCSQEKPAHVKTTTSNRIATQQDSEWDGDQQVDGSYASKQEVKNPQCNDTHKAAEIDTSGDKSRTRQEHKEQATDNKIWNMERNKEKFHMKTGRDDRCKAQGPQCLHNHKEPDALAYKFGNHDLSSSSTLKSHPWHNDDQRALKTENKSRDGRGSGRNKGDSSLERRHPQKRPGVYSSEGGHSQKRSRGYSPEGRGMDYHDSYRRSNDQHRYEQRRRSNGYSSDGDDDRRLGRHEDYSSEGDRRRYRRDGDWRRYHREHNSSDGDGDRGRYRGEDYSSDRDGDKGRYCREDYCSDGDVGRRRLSPRQSEFSPGNRSSMPCPASYPRRTEYDGRRRHGPPSYGGRHGPYMNSRGSEDVNYAMDQRTAPSHRNPPNAEYDEYTNLGYGRYNALDMAPPVDRYSRQEDYTGAYGPPTDAGAAFYGGRFSDYGEGSGYQGRNRLNLEDRALAAGSVTEKYAPRLDRTNLPVRGQGGLHDAW